MNFQGGGGWRSGRRHSARSIARRLRAPRPPRAPAHPRARDPDSAPRALAAPSRPRRLLTAVACSDVWDALERGNLRVEWSVRLRVCDNSGLSGVRPRTVFCPCRMSYEYEWPTPTSCCWTRWLTLQTGDVTPPEQTDRVRTCDNRWQHSPWAQHSLIRGRAIGRLLPNCATAMHLNSEFAMYLVAVCSKLPNVLSVAVHSRKSGNTLQWSVMCYI